MSILIKDMEKPKSCYAIIDGEFEYCPFVNTDDDCVLLLKKGICEGTWQEQYSKCPLVEEPERKKGKWIKDSEKYDAITHICSVCGSTMTTLKPTIANYCWHCGAVMTSDKPSDKRQSKQQAMRGEQG